MTIGKMLNKPILSIIHSRLVISPLIGVRREIKIIVKVFDQFAKMVKSLPMVSTLLKSKNKTKNLKNNKTWARSNTINVKKWVIMPIYILIKGEKTSFSLGKFFNNDFSQYESCFFSVLSFWFPLLILHYWSTGFFSTIWSFHFQKLKKNLIIKLSKILALKKIRINSNKIIYSGD